MLPEVQTDTLKPEVTIPQSSPTSVKSTDDDLLLSVNEKETVEEKNSTSNQILDDLNDLKFEENTDLEGNEMNSFKFLENLKFL